MDSPDRPRAIGLKTTGRSHETVFAVPTQTAVERRSAKRAGDTVNFRKNRILATERKGWPCPPRLVFLPGLLVNVDGVFYACTADSFSPR